MQLANKNSQGLKNAYCSDSREFEGNNLFLTNRNEFINRLLIVILIILTVILQLIISIKVPHITSDSIEYLALGESIFHGRGFVTINDAGEYIPNIIRSPGYPIYLAACKFINNDNIKCALITQVIIFTSTLLLLYKCIFDKFKSVALIVFQICILLSPTVTAYTGIIGPESLTVSLLILLVLQLINNRFPLIRSFASGVLAGNLTLLRYNLIFLAVFIPIYYFLTDKTMKRMMLSALGLVMVLAPWTYRNYQEFDRVTPILTFSKDWSMYTYIENYHGIMVGHRLSRNDWPDSLELNILRSEVEEINKKIGVPVDSNLLYFWGDKNYNTIELQNKAAYELSVLKIDKMKQVGFLDYAARRIFLMSPFAWITKSYPPFVPRVISICLILFSLIILVVSIFALRFLLNSSIRQILTLFVLSGFLVCYSSISAVILPIILFVFLMYQYDSLDRLLVLSIGIFYHYSLIPMILHLEARYTVPARPFIYLLSSVYLSHIYSHSLNKLLSYIATCKFTESFRGTSK